MKKALIYILVIMGSCNADKDKSTTVTTDSTSAEPTVTTAGFTSGCYRMQIEKDSAFMDISVNGSEVSGKLDYKRFEKDSNTGDFKGIIDRDKVIGWYTFQSEGMVSVRQMIYRISNDTLFEGYGDIDVSNDTAFFKYPANLNYELQHPFTKTPCE